MPTQSIGGSNVMLQVKGPEAGNSPLETAKDILTLAELGSRLKQAPLDLQLKQNQVSQIPISNETAATELIAKRNAEIRAQDEFKWKNIGALPGIFQQSPELGMQRAKELGLASAQNKDGTFSLGAQLPDGSMKVFTIDPNKVADPEKRLTFESNFRKEWEASPQAKNYGVISTGFRNMQKLAADNTGSSDIAMLYSFIKVLDPTSVVREGEIQLSRQGSTILEQAAAKYRQAWQTGAPVLDPQFRQRMVASAGQEYDTARADAILHGQRFGGLVKDSGFDPKRVLTPTGDLTYENIISGDVKKVAGAPRTKGTETGAVPPEAQQPSLRPRAQEASVVPGVEGTKPAAKEYNRIEDTLGNMFQLPGGKKNAAPQE